MPDNVVRLEVEHASPDGETSKAELYLDNINAPRPNAEAFGAVLKSRLENALIPIQEAHRRQFIHSQFAVMDKLLNAVIQNWSFHDVAAEQIRNFQAELSYVLLLLIAPGSIDHTKPLLKLAQCNTKVMGAYALFMDEESTLDDFRKARKILADASTNLGQASNLTIWGVDVEGSN